MTSASGLNFVYLFSIIGICQIIWNDPHRFCVQLRLLDPSSRRPTDTTRFVPYFLGLSSGIEASQGNIVIQYLKTWLKTVLYALQRWHLCKFTHNLIPIFYYYLSICASRHRLAEQTAFRCKCTCTNTI